MSDLRRLNKVLWAVSIIGDVKKYGVSGRIGSGKNKEIVILESGIDHEESIHYYLAKWEKKIGVLWAVIQMNKNHIQTYNQCPECGDENDRRYQNYLDGKYKPLDGEWTPFPCDFGGDGYITIRCQKCNTLFNMDNSS
jgi:predicted RNA-binding Zn-ribbon protein involved in translation (DUF1610 family)